MRDRDGFTLVEILIAMLISAILVLGIHASYQQAHRLWSQAEDGRQSWYLARLLTETWREELAGLYLPPKTGDPNQESAGGPAGFTLNSVPGETVELSFFTLTPAWRTEPGSSRTARVGYRFARDPDSGVALLQRLETLCAGAKPIGMETADVLVQDLAEFRIWVFDPNSGSSDAWKESYESDDRPPGAVRVLLKWRAGRPDDPRAREVKFESVICVPCEAALGAPTP